MKVIEDLRLLQGEYPGVVLTLGNFDGIHIGHRAILEWVVTQAKRIKGTSVVFTFQKHPLKTLTADNSPPLLTTLEEKLALLEELGIETAVCIPFTREIAYTDADQFIREIIYPRLHPHWIAVGHNYAFGKNRAGNTALLKRWATHYSYRVKVFQPVVLDKTTVSSTLIRQRIAQGQVEGVTRLLGRPYSLQSQVTAGRQKGKGLDYRTANLAPQSKLLPGRGVYAVKVQLENKLYQGVANIGYQPTYAQNELQVEVHLLDFSADLYGRQLRVAFIAKLREEQAFASEAALNRQISQDIGQARQILAKAD